MMQQRLEIFGRFLERSGLEKKVYQMEGVAWCLEREMGSGSGSGVEEVPFGDVRGGFVADEMGLGKTITMLGLMTCYRVPKTLIVLPVALIDQWLAQIRRTTDFAPLVYHGASKKKVRQEDLERASVVVTSYHPLQVGKGGAGGALHRIVWDRIIFDEAHHLRNRQTNVFRGAAMMQASIRWFVSGTLVQNGVRDFLHLCLLLGVPSSFCAQASNIEVLFREFVLRRKKDEVGLGLAPFDTLSLSVAFSGEEERACAEAIHSTLPFYKPPSPSDLDDDDLSDLTKDSLEPVTADLSGLVRYMRAKQICILPRLAVPCVSGSSKLNAVVEKILERKDNDNGKLVFCHFQAEMDELEARIVTGGICRVAKLDGRTSAVQRKRILGSAYDVLLLQIQTCCEGLNLQEFYSEIYFVTPHWNPSVESQAIARCHRMGQTKPVHVFRFLMEGTRSSDSLSADSLSADSLSDSLSADSLSDSLSDSYTSFDTYVMSVQETKRNAASAVGLG